MVKFCGYGAQPREKILAQNTEKTPEFDKKYPLVQRDTPSVAAASDVHIFHCHSGLASSHIGLVDLGAIVQDY